jgi:hypothetical protein
VNAKTSLPNDRYRKPLKLAISAAGVALVMLSASACSAPSPSPSASSPAAPAVAEPTKSTNVTILGPAQNAKGKYLQTTTGNIEDEAGYDPKLAQIDPASTFTADEVKFATGLAVRYIATEGIDSVLQDSNDPADVEKWWAENKDGYAPEIQAGVYEAAKTNQAIVVRGGLSDVDPSGLTYWYDESSPRIESRNNKINWIKVDSARPDIIQTSTTLDYNIWGMDKSKGKHLIHVTGEYRLAMRKGTSMPGEWVIAGMHLDYKSTPLTK